MISFDHVHLCCTDLDASIQFWTEALGATFIRRRKFGTADGAVVSLQGVQIFFKKIPEDSPLANASARGLNHLGIRVPDPNALAENLVNNYGCTLLNKASEDCSFVATPHGVTFELMRIGADI